jgi:hypothetical protein
MPAPAVTPGNRRSSILNSTTEIFMLPDLFFGRIVAPTLDWMAASPGVGIPASDSARVLVMAIAGQESRWAARRQIGGPARGYWQCERGGAVVGVLTHPAAALKARAVLGVEDVPSDYDTVYEALAWHDRLACAFARLLLWTDPRPLPALGDHDASWDYYLRNWRPGAPHPESWATVYDQARAVIRQAA